MHSSKQTKLRSNQKFKKFRTNKSSTPNKTKKPGLAKKLASRIKTTSSGIIRKVLSAMLSLFEGTYNVLAKVFSPLKKIFGKPSHTKLAYLFAITAALFAVIIRIDVDRETASQVQLIQEKEQTIDTLEEKETQAMSELEEKEELLEEVQTDVEKLKDEQEKKDEEIKRLEEELQAKRERQAEEALLARSTSTTSSSAATTATTTSATTSSYTPSTVAASSGGRTITTNYGQTLNIAPGTDHNNYPYGQCTYFVATQIPVPNALGDAMNWRYSLASYGWTVSSTPRAGAIGTAGNHVVYVNSVNGDGTITISEMNRNYDGDNINWRTVSASTFTYIYQ